MVDLADLTRRAADGGNRDGVVAADVGKGDDRLSGRFSWLDCVLADFGRKKFVIGRWLASMGSS
jgi:hypothetical protein